MFIAMFITFDKQNFDKANLSILGREGAGLKTLNDLLVY
jgi:hypothetical protein